MVIETVVDEKFIQSMEKYRIPNKELGFIGACADNPVVFAQHMLGMRLYAWQVLFMKQLKNALSEDTEQKEFVAITSRQIGKSTLLAVFSLWCAVFNKKPGTLKNNTIVGIASASDEQAKKLLMDMKRLINMGDIHMKKERKIEKFFSDLIDEHSPNNMTTITFKPYDKAIHSDYLLKDSLSGSVIGSYPPTSRVLGETFTVVIIDEAGKTDKITDTFFYDYMYPTGNSTDAIRIYTSTPWENSGFFYRMVDPDDLFGGSPADVVLFTIDAIKIENPKYYKTVMKVINQLNADGKTNEVQRAYYCRFIKGEKAYFDKDDVMNMFTNEYQMTNNYIGPCDMGVDFGGQTTSKTVITITEMRNEKEIRRLYHKSYEVGKDDNLIEDIEQLMTRFNVQRVIPDDCLVSGTEVIMSDYTRKNIEEVKAGEMILSYNFTTDTYENKKVLSSIEKSEGKVYEVALRNGTSVRASPRHRWYVKDRVTKKLSIVTTEELNPKKHYLPTAINIPDKGVNTVSPEEAYVLGIYIAEGHKRPTKHGFFISQIKEETCELIEYMLNKTNIKWQKNKKGFYLSNTYELESLFNECGTSSYTKRIPKKCFTWCRENLEFLYRGLIDGDGNIQYEHNDKRGYKVSKTESYYTVSDELNKDVRQIMLMLNKPTHFRSRVHSGFKSTKVQYEPVWSEGSVMNNGKTFIKYIRETHPEKTYCIEVEDNHSFVLAESCIITSNCPQGDYMIRKMIDKGWDVQPMNFRSDKIKKYGAFRSTLKRGFISSYMDEQLRTEMLALEQKQGLRNAMIEHAPGYSDDHIDSFLMSCYFFVQEECTFGFFDYNNLDGIEESKPHTNNLCPQCDSKKIERQLNKNICMECKYEWLNT